MKSLKSGFRLISCVFALLVAASVAMADGADAIEAGGDKNAVSGLLSVDLVTHYFNNGILQENQGLILQPGLEVSLDVFDGDGFVSDAALVVGTRNSIHSNRTGSMRDELAPWYEADGYVGFDLGVGNFTQRTVFNYEHSPNDAFDKVSEFELSLTYDDGSIWEGKNFHGFQPYVLVAIEVDGAADGFEEGTYLEVGIEPGLTIVQIGDAPLDLFIPVRLGVDLEDYYQTMSATSTDTGLGFIEVGAKLQTRFPGTNGVIHAGPYLLFLEDGPEMLNNGGDWELIGRVGVEFPF